MNPDPTTVPTSEIRPVYADPKGHWDYDEDGENPTDHSVGWALSFGCQLTFGYEDDQLTVTVSTSDRDKQAGITKRTVTPEAVTQYAQQLLALVALVGAVPGTPAATTQADETKSLPALLMACAGMLEALSGLPASLRRCADIARLQQSRIDRLDATSPILDVEDLTARLAAADIVWGREIGDPTANPDYLKYLAEKACAFESALSPAPGNGPRPEPARTWTTHHVTATRDIPEGHTGQRVRYAYNGDSWDGWLIGTGREFGVDEAYVMCDDGTRWVVLPDNITPIEAASVAQEGGE